MARGISWIKATLKDFQRFPEAVQDRAIFALRAAARGEKPETVKPMKGLGSGIFGIYLRHKGDAFRVVYAVQLDRDVWVLHAFQKKSKTGIKTPAAETNLIRERIKRLKEQLP